MWTTVKCNFNFYLILGAYRNIHSEFGSLAQMVPDLNAKFDVSSFYASCDLCVHTDRQMDVAQLTTLMLLITFLALPRFLLHVTYICTK